MSFEKAFQKTCGIEGGYSDDARDRGGKTRFGVTERVARRWGYKGEMRDLPLETARDIARYAYWDAMKLDGINEISERVAEELFDTGYNMGIHAASCFFQRALNGLNRNEKDYANIKVDGAIGAKTIAAFTAFIAFRKAQGEIVMMRLLNSFQAERYVLICENDEPQEDFLFGWVLQRVQM
jgi:lysozyme family protein